MKKSHIKKITLGIACLLGVGGAITAGVLSTNSPSINNAEAATTYGLHVGNIEVTSENLTIDSSDTTDITSGSATYNPETKTLTLDNFNYQGAGYSDGSEGGAIDSRGNDLTILLKGNNSILKQNDNSINKSHGIYFKTGTLTVDKDSSGGSLTISFWSDRSGGKSNGIFLEPGSFVMNGGTVVSNAGRGNESAGIYASSGITFNGGSFTGRGYTTTAYESRGIYAHGVITINGGEVFGYAPLDNPYAAYAYDNYEIRFNEGDLYAEGKTAFKSASYVYYPSGTTILGGNNEASATEQTNVKGGLHYYNLSFTTHVHNWSYTADGASITAECHNSGCPITSGLTLTVSDPADIVYDGTTKEIQLNSYNKKAFDTPEIKYYKDNVLVSECINAGLYEARVSANGKTAIKSFSISKADGTLTPPTAKPIIGYTGSAQELINAGSATGGTIWYKLGTDGTYTESIPTATDVGTYYVYYKVIGDANHNDIEETGPIEVTITDAVATITNGTTVTFYTDFATALANWDNGTTLTLYKDLKLSSEISVSSGSKTFNLNGYTLTGDGNHGIFFVNGGSLTVNGGNGILTGGKGHLNEYTKGGALHLASGNVTVNSCNFKNNTAQYGGAIYLAGGTITLNDCKLYDNTATSPWDEGDDGALFAEGKNSNASVIVNGGEIYSNASDSGIVLAGWQTHTSSAQLNGVNIHNNSQYGVNVRGDNVGRASISVSGNTIIESNTLGNLRLQGNSTTAQPKVSVASALGANASIGITMTNKGVFTNSANTSYNDESKFFSDDSNYGVKKDDGQLTLTSDVATIKVGSDITYYNSLTSALSNWVDGSTLTLLKNVSISSTINVNDNSTKTFDLNGCGLLMTGNDSVFNLGGSLNVTIVDSSPNHPHKIQLDNYRGVAVDGGCTTTDPINNGTGIVNITGGYITGGTGKDNLNGGGLYIDGGSVIFNGGTVIGNRCDEEYCDGGGIYVQSNGNFTMNGGSIIYNYSGNSGAGIGANHSTIEINGGVISYNRNNWAGGGAMSLDNSSSLKLYGGVIENNVSRHPEGAICFKSANQNLSIKGSPIVRNNTCVEGGYAVNLRLFNGQVAHIDGPLTAEAYIHICYVENAQRAITDGWSTHMAGKDPNDYFVNDNPNYQLCLKDGEAWLSAGHTVTFNTNGRGVAPDPVIVDDGSLVNKPTDPTVEGYELKGWYKEAECENIWDFDNDTVTEDITLYALWDYDEATGNVIKLINDIGTLTYDGGSSDSLDDILAAINGYDALTPVRKVIVDGVNKDILDHDVTTYKNVDKVGDLINAIPEPSPDKSYYDAIDLAKAEYDKLTEEELTLLNSKIDFEKILNDNIAARKVIIEIEEIGEVTYDGGINDSKKDIEKAEKSYDELSKDQKDIVDYVNHDVLVDDREIYDQMAKAIKAIKEIGKVENNEETKEKIEEARKIYDSLPDELKEWVKRYEDSLKVLEDDEKVLDVLVLIDDIGDVNYDSVSQEKIQEARRHYDSLTEDQKRLIAPEALEKLEEKEATYTSINNTGNSLLIVFLIISGLLLILGLIVMYFIIRKKKEDNGDDNNDDSANKSKTMKLASFTGFMPFIIYASHYLDPGYILLYIIIALTVIVWLTNLVLFILKKKGIILKKKKEESKPAETVKEPEPVKPVVIAKEPEPVNEEEEEEVVTITDEKGNIFNIRYIKSFTAKLIQSPDETKKYYEELKNYVLSYKKTTSRVSWHYDSINSGRNQVLKFAIRGKTLCVYYPLNASDYEDSKYKVEAVESKKFEEVPCLYRIKNDRRLGYAKDLIDTVMSNLGLVRGEEQHEVYSNLPYEPNKPLIDRGLIKEQKIQVNKPAEQVVSKKVNEDGDEIITTKDSSGNLFEIRYIKSFTAKLSQASAEVKDYYNELKNYALSYKKANSRISWHFDSINVGRNQVVKFSIRGKTLCVYYALNAEDYNDTKYKVEVVESKKFEEVPCLYRIKNDRRRDYAKDLIDTVMANVPTEKGKESSEDFRVPYESTKALLAKGLIKENKVQVNKPVEDKPVEQMSEDEEEVITITDEKGNIFNIRYIKSFTAKLIQSPDETKKYYEELKNYVLSYKKTTSRVSWHYDSINSGRNQILKFSIRGKTLCVYYALDANDYLDSKYKVEAVDSKKFEEVPCLYRIKNDRRLGYAKNLIDTVMANLGLVKGEEQHEVYSNLPYEPNAPLIARGLIKELKVQVNKPVAPVVIKAEEVDVKMSDEEATSQIKEDSGSKKHIGKKGIINIDVIAKSFANNEVVNIESLWKKKIISKNIGHVKVLARGSLDKKLNIELQDYSLQAVKMILLAGGTVKRVK